MDEAEVDVQAVEEIRQKAALATERERAVQTLQQQRESLRSYLFGLLCKSCAVEHDHCKTEKDPALFEYFFP